MKPLFWFKVTKGVICAIIVTFAFLCLFAFLGSRSDDPAKYVALYSNCALFLGCALGGGVAVCGADSKPVHSLICGLACALLVFIPSILFSHWGVDSLLRMVLTVFSALLGGFLLRGREGRTNKRQRVKRRKEIAKKYGI